jgi:hypothetical protein
MNKLEKAQAQLEGEGITTRIENETLYVYVGDTPLELADFEIRFRAKLWDDHKREEFEELS